MICCPCGGFTVTNHNKHGRARLRYECCGSCGRCGRFVLQLADQQVSQGEVARRAFQDDALLSRLIAKRTDTNTDRLRTNNEHHGTGST